MKRRHVVLLIAAVSLWIFAAAQSGTPRGSSFSTPMGGARALLLVFQELGLPASPWLQPFTDLDSAELTPRGKPATLFVIDGQNLHAAGGSRLLKWIESGNQLVFMGSPEQLAALRSVGAGKSASGIVGDPVWFEFDDEPRATPLRCTGAPVEACGGVQQISAGRFAFPPVDRWLNGRPILLAGSEERPQALWQRIGRGEAWFFGDAAAALNSEIDQFDNLRLLYQIASRFGGPVLFDEFHHGYRQPTSAARAGQRAALLLLTGVLLALLILGALSRSVRFGAPAPRPAAARAATVEFASVLGLLYRDHGASSVLRHYLDAWRRRLEKRAGIRARLSDAHLLEALERGRRIEGVRGLQVRSALRTLAGDAAVSEEALQRHIRSLEDILEGYR